MYKLITSTDFTNVFIPDNTFIQAKIRVKGDRLIWSFRSKRERDRTINLFMNAGMQSVRRCWL